MKLAGISGKGRGRLGSMVFSASAGEQIVRQYQPNVSNPNTAAQVNQRAKFKLMAQVAAAVSGEIIIPRNGLQSPRNLFQKKNFGLLATDGDTATLQYEGLQFTAGNVAIPAVSAARAANGINVALSAAANVSRVVYLAYRKSAQGALQFASSTIVDAAGDAGTFPATLASIDGEAVIYAYGMRDLSASASAKYGNYSVSDGTALATLVLSRTLSSSDYQFTRTSGTTLPVVVDTQSIDSITIQAKNSSGQNVGDPVVIRDGSTGVQVPGENVTYFDFDVTMKEDVETSASNVAVFTDMGTIDSSSYETGPIVLDSVISGLVKSEADTYNAFVMSTLFGVRISGVEYSINFTRA